MARILILAAAVGSLAFTVTGAGMHSASASGASPGEQIFRANCASCHSPSVSGGPSIGPHLFGIVGRKAGTVSGYNYSAAMKDSGVVWTKDELKRFLAEPHQAIPGNRMPFAGIHDQAKLDQLVDYLETLGHSHR